MLAQVLLTPTESKKFIARAVAGLPEVKRANEMGVVALHPSSSTIFLAMELTGKVPDTRLWVSGLNSPRGADRSFEAAEHLASNAAKKGPGGYTYTWLISKGTLTSGIPVAELINRLGPGDVFIKGVNAIDPAGAAAVLIGNKIERGTIGMWMAAAERKGFQVILPAGLEKLIPVPVQQAAEAAARRGSLDYSMGTPCALLPCRGKVITELDAVALLGSGARATPISAGGLAGAEGAVTLVIEGTDAQVRAVIRCIEDCKGAALPRELRLRAGAGEGPWLKPG